MSEMKFNITLKELRQAAEFAQEHGWSEHKTITMRVSPGEIGNGIEVSAGFDGDPTDITDFDAW